MARIFFGEARGYFSSQEQRLREVCDWGRFFERAKRNKIFQPLRSQRFTKEILDLARLYAFAPKLLSGIAVLGGVVEVDFAAGALFGGVDDAGVEGARVDVDADGTLVEVAGIEDAVDGLLRIDGARLRDIHLDSFGGLDGGFPEGEVLMEDVKIFDEQAANGDGHPAILVAVVVHGTGLADFPADGDEFVERSFIDQIAGVVLAVPGEVGSERVGVERCVAKEFAELPGFIEGGSGEVAELGDEILDGGQF
jgi:hypothetical protein